MDDVGSKLFVITLGFDESHAIRSLILHNRITEGDLVIFVVPRDGLKNERTKEALKTIERVVKYFIGREEFYEVIELYVPDKEDPEGSFYKSLARLSEEVLKKAREISAMEIIFDISGGMRILTIISLLSAYIVSSRVLQRSIRIEIETEDKIMHVSIPVRIFNVILSPNEKLVLEALDEEGALSTKELLERTKIRRTTLYYTLRGLMAEGLVENKERKYYITSTGRAILYLSLGKYLEPSETSSPQAPHS